MFTKSCNVNVIMQVFRKRTFIDYENAIGALLHCEEQLDEGWRKADGYWGNVP